MFYHWCCDSLVSLLALLSLQVLSQNVETETPELTKFHLHHRLSSKTKFLYNKKCVTAASCPTNTYPNTTSTFCPLPPA